MHQPIRLSHPGADTLVLCVHGFLGSPGQMEPLARAAHTAGCEALSLLLPGHGGTGRDFAAATADAWLAHVAGALAEHRGRYRRIFLVGHSMGGLLALNAAGQCPVQGLLLIACPLRLRRPGPGPALVRLRQIVYPKRHPMKAAYLSGSSVPVALPLLWHSLRPTAELKKLMMKTVLMLPRVDAPVTAVYSAGDEMVSQASWDVLKAGLTGAPAQCILLREACHAYYPPHEQARIIQALMNMLNAPDAL